MSFSRKIKIKKTQKTQKNVCKNIAILSVISAFLIAGIVFAKHGHRVFSLCSFAAATGVVLFHLPLSYAFVTSFLSVSLALVSNFFAILNHYINGSTLHINK